MKKITALIMAILMGATLTACGGISSSAEINPPADNNSQTPEKAEEADATDEMADSNETQETDSIQTTKNGSNILVAYFSATGTTKGVAQEMASALEADLYEIVPEEPYTDEDLDYSDDNSRSTIEMNDASARPAISGSIDNMEQYEIVFLGYPIWWGDAPRIVSTFVESYDFSGKTIVPFCTSGGSGIGSSGSKLEKLTSGATWLSGERFSGNSSYAEIVDWLNGLGLNLTAE